MYSSSSSEGECEYDDSWQYENNYNQSFGSCFRQNPFYPTMGHPLIYYAQVPQAVCMKQCGREQRKDNPNCFVRAFRWYTEEHVPNRIESLQTYTNKPNKRGFAAWLDDKYEQYLEDVQNPNLYHVKMKQTAVIETEKIPDDYCEPTKAKRFRVKSPWRKRRRARSNETAIVLKKSSHSFQYLLQPKENSCHASEYGHSSTTTVKTEYGKKSVVRSQSCSCISLRDEEPLDVVVPQEGAANINHVVQKNNCQTCKPETKTIMIKCHSIQRVPTQDFGCQNPAKETENQYELEPSAKTVKASPKESSVACECPKVTPSEPGSNLNNKHNAKPICSYDEATQNDVECECPVQPPVKQDVQTQCECVISNHNICCGSKETEDSPPVKSVPKIVFSGCVCTKQDVIRIPSKKCTTEVVQQTSDCNIRLEQGTNEYPIFLKIVCADKLNCEC